ncbi:MAG TPA: hypothetical protein VMM78_20070 [Thermomicrobiales bacterium]|nr:hypothetical protein [Thermomicrobiales bacterium]
MVASTRIIGLVLMAAGAAIGLVAVAWLLSGVYDPDGDLEWSGAILGLAVIFAVVVFPLAGGGLVVYRRGSAEATLFERAGAQRKLLGIIEAAGEITIADLALQLQGTRDSVRDDLYDLVSKGLFAGYVDWDRGVLYARQASQMRQNETCPNCGGALSLAGKGLIRCQYCGAEIFLP